MGDWKYLVLRGAGYNEDACILVRYKCTDKEVSRDEIEDAISSYYESAYPETDEQMVVDVMASFKGVVFYILPCEGIYF